MSKFFQDPNFWVSITSVCIAIFALFQSNKQIKISNKQSLFDKRMEIFSLTNELLENYKNYHKHIFTISEKADELAMRTLFRMFTNIPSLIMISNSLGINCDEKLQREFFYRVNYLGSKAKEIEFLFDNNYQLLVDFINDYKSILIKINEQMRFIDVANTFRSIDENAFNKEYKQRLLENAEDLQIKETIDKLYEAYNEIINSKIINNLSDEIKLK